MSSSDDALIALVRLDREKAESVNVDTSSKLKSLRELEPFVHISVRDLLIGTSMLDGVQEVLVWIYILRELHMRRSMGVLGSMPVTNVGLAQWGVSRFAKRRAIDKLSKAGLLQVEKHGGRNPRVTVAVPLRERGRSLGGARAQHDLSAQAHPVYSFLVLNPRNKRLNSRTLHV